MNKRYETTHILLYLVLVLLVWVGIALLPGPHQETLIGSEAQYDLEDYAFEDTVYNLDATWDSWPEKLYLPQELSSAGEPLSSRDINYAQTNYATYRLTLKIQPDKAYGLMLYATKHAMRLFVDGKEVMSAGWPGETREDTETRVYREVHYFTPENDTTEIVVQTATFVHWEGSQPPDLTLGTQQDISRSERESAIRSGLITGCLAAAFLFHLGIFLLNRRQRASLLFAILCLLLAIQSSEFIFFLVPTHDWLVATRIEYLVNLSALITLILLIRKLFPQTLNIWVYRIFISLCILYCVVVLFTDSMIYSQGLPFFQAFSIALALYVLLRLALTLREKNVKNILAFIGLLFVGICGIGDVLYRNGLLPFELADKQVLSIGTGAMLLVFCYVLVLAIEQAEVNKRMEDMYEGLSRAEDRYTKLVEEKQGEGTLDDRLVDLGLTKREREVASLLICGKNREDIAGFLFVSIGTVNTHCSNIYRKVECSSVAELAHRVNSDWFS